MLETINKIEKRKLHKLASEKQQLYHHFMLYSDPIQERVDGKVGGVSALSLQRPSVLYCNPIQSTSLDVPYSNGSVSRTVYPARLLMKLSSSMPP